MKCHFSQFPELLKSKDSINLLIDETVYLMTSWLFSQLHNMNEINAHLHINLQ